MRFRLASAALFAWFLAVPACSRSGLDDDLFGAGISTAGGFVDGSLAGAGGSGATGATGNGGGAGSIGSAGSLGSGGSSSAGGASGASGKAGSGGAVGSGGAPPRCGDGHVDAGESCDLGLGNANRPAFVVQQGAAAFAVLPIARAATATSFYNYFSASSHTGFEQVGTSLAMLYQDRNTSTLSLVVLHGIDQGTSGQIQPNGHAALAFAGLPLGVVVALSDDLGELFLTSQTTAQGDWHFNRNSDGGILSGLPFPGSWSIAVTPAFFSSISSWQFNDDRAADPLSLTAPVTITAYDTHSACRVDCTVPRCGDGILDGGEVCDDGNVVSGDGCSADCRSLF